MFRDIVSRLSFSPALVGQLSFYAKRLRKEQVTRRLALIFTVLALIVQSFVVFQGPESANAASSNDFVYGGLGLGSQRSLNNFLAPYDSNTNHLKDIMNSFGITREEIAATTWGSFTASGSRFSWGHHARSFDAGSLAVRDSSGAQVTTVYGRPTNVLNKEGSTIYAYIGYSKAVGWFAIMQSCGNLVTDHIPTPKTPDPGILELSKSARNISQGNVVASSVTATSSDRITYTLTAKNTGGSAISASFSDDLADVLEYAQLTDTGGGSYDKTTKKLSWPSVSLAAGASESRTYSVKLASTIPSTPTGVSDQTSYDCVMDNVFGNGVQIKVACETPKVVEQVVTELPKTGPGENMLFGGVVLALVTYFYFRSKQMNKEVRLIRRDLTAGTL